MRTTEAEPLRSPELIDLYAKLRAAHDAQDDAEYDRIWDMIDRQETTPNWWVDALKSSP